MIIKSGSFCVGTSLLPHKIVVFGGVVVCGLLELFFCVETSFQRILQFSNELIKTLNVRGLLLFLVEEFHDLRNKRLTHLELFVDVQLLILQTLTLIPSL